MTESDGEDKEEATEATSLLNITTEPATATNPETIELLSLQGARLAVEEESEDAAFEDALEGEDRGQSDRHIAAAESLALSEPPSVYATPQHVPLSDIPDVAVVDAESAERQSVHVDSCFERSVRYVTTLTVDTAIEDLSHVPGWVASKTSGLLERIRDAYEANRSLFIKQMVIGSIIAAIVVVGLALLPFSFQVVNYYEMALYKSSLQRWVDISRVYTPGCYFVGPDAVFLKFPSTYQVMEFPNMHVVNNETMSMDLSVVMFYTIRPHELGLLFDKYERDYESVFHRVVMSTIKNRVANMSLQEILQQRETVQRDFHRAVYARMTGDCCQSCCATSSCDHFRLSASDCSTCRKSSLSCMAPFHVDVVALQILGFNFHQDLKQRMERVVLLQIKAATAEFQQVEALERIKISQQVQSILNQADEVSATAYAAANLTITRALAKAEVSRITAESTGVAFLKSTLSLSVISETLSFFYLNMLDRLQQAGQLFVFNKSALFVSHDVLSNLFT